MHILFIIHICAVHVKIRKVVRYEGEQLKVKFYILRYLSHTYHVTFQ